MDRHIKIATRVSPLARWQTSAVIDALKFIGLPASELLLESSGDLHLQQPIYAMGISGVFTRQLDAALLSREADLAVHSLKDVPTKLAQGLALAAVLPRASWQDVILIKDRKPVAGEPYVVATGSLRRKAQWLSRFPDHTVEPIRGNVQTRLQKFKDNPWDAVVFAAAGLERLDLLKDYDHIYFPWMLPAPAQGIIGIVCREDDQEMLALGEKLNHAPSMAAALAERAFMAHLQGGCSVPVSAFAELRAQELFFRGEVYDYDGKSCFEVTKRSSASDPETLGKQAAESLLQQDGAADLIRKFRDRHAS
jgi:hydroxymethylbilane synthase